MSIDRFNKSTEKSNQDILTHKLMAQSNTAMRKHHPKANKSDEVVYDLAMVSGSNYGKPKAINLQIKKHVSYYPVNKS